MEIIVMPPKNENSNHWIVVLIDYCLALERCQLD